MYISINEPAKIMLYERMGSAAGPNTVAKYTQRRIDGVSSATPYRRKKQKIQVEQISDECLLLTLCEWKSFTSSTQIIGKTKLRKFFNEFI